MKIGDVLPDGNVFHYSPSKANENFTHLQEISISLIITMKLNFFFSKGCKYFTTFIFSTSCRGRGGSVTALPSFFVED